MIAILAGVYDPIGILFTALLAAAFVIEAWAFVDVIRRPAGAFVAVGKQTKPIWLLISGVAAVLGFAFFYLGGITQILAVAAFVAGAIYHVDVRPKVKDFRQGRGTSNGPYGPWLLSRDYEQQHDARDEQRGSEDDPGLRRSRQRRRRL